MEIKDYFFKYLWVVTLLLIFGVCYFAAGTLNAYLAKKIIPTLPPSTIPAAPAAADAAANYHPDPGAIIKRNLFSIELVVPGEGPEGNQPAATLNAKLLGIVYFSLGSAWNRATVKMLDDNKSQVFKEGDEVKEGSGMVVETIEEKLIRVRYASGKEEELALEDKQKKMAGVVPADQMYVPDAAKLPPEARERAMAEARKAAGLDISNKVHKISEKEYVIEQALIQDSLQNLNNLLQQARMVPNVAGGGDNKAADGFRIFRIQPNSIFSQLGLHNGDVIKAINGVKMDTVERGLELLQQLRSQKNFTLDIGRQDQNMTISYRVE